MQTRALVENFLLPGTLTFSRSFSLTAVMAAAFLHFCPSPTVISAPVVIDYEPMSVVRAQTAGFAETIHVENGDYVEPGQLLVTLENRELALALNRNIGIKSESTHPDYRFRANVGNSFDIGPDWIAGFNVGGSYETDWRFRRTQTANFQFLCIICLSFENVGNYNNSIG